MIKNPLILKLTLFIAIFISSFTFFAFFDVLVLDEIEKNKLCEKKFPINKNSLDTCKRRAILIKNKNGQSYIMNFHGGA